MPRDFSEGMMFHFLDSQKKKTDSKNVESLSEELACDQTSRDEAAFTLLALGGGLPTYSEAGTNTDPDPLVLKFEELQQDYIGIQKEYQRLLDEKVRFKEQIDAGKFTYRNLTSGHVKAYTGLPTMAAFLYIFSLVAVFLKQIGKVSAGDQLLLELMKLRLNLTNKLSLTTDRRTKFGRMPRRKDRRTPTHSSESWAVKRRRKLPHVNSNLNNFAHYTISCWTVNESGLLLIVACTTLADCLPYITQREDIDCLPCVTQRGDTADSFGISASRPKSTQANPRRPKSTQSNQDTPSRPKSTQVDPSRPKSTQVNPINPHTPSRPKSTQVDPSRPKSIEVDPSQPKSTQANPRHLSQPKLTQVNPSRPNQPKLTQVNPSRPNQPKLTQVNPSRPKSTQVDPSQTKSTQVDPSQPKSTQVNPSRPK
ncbi:hypothetical protein DPMN_181271 [Dreissena polymorpha]|uniref:Uncharacterized protein n=1 Tax=Dreissena polymorpha TaxID=45954 RepID=A0A9D4DFX3_DREPO|nr:hypothetical protein DPMN_181271 [Dreissena polymorpha]